MTTPLNLALMQYAHHPLAVFKVAEFAQFQPNSWTCGPAALRHALLAHGIRASVQAVAALSGTTATTCPDVKGLKAAARSLTCKLEERRFHIPSNAWAFIRTNTHHGNPVLLAVDRDTDGLWQHWITVLHTTSRHVWIADSQEPGPVIQRLTWHKFIVRACAWVGPVEGTCFDLYPLVKT